MRSSNIFALAGLGLSVAYNPNWSIYSCASSFRPAQIHDMRMDHRER